MAATSFTINGKTANVEAEPDTPLLWVVREQLKLTGTKFGCGSGLCGACTVHVDGKAVRSCQISVVEGGGHARSPPSKACRRTAQHPLQKAWIAEQVPQCGYCQSGQIMQAATLARGEQEADARADRRAHGRQHLPLRHLSAHRARHPTRRAGGLSHDQADQERFVDTNISRRGFVAGAAGLTFAFTLGGMRPRRGSARSDATAPSSTPGSPSRADNTITHRLSGRRNGAGRATRRCR